MFPTKSPGVDGMWALFYQKYWGVVDNDVVGYCLNVLNGGASVKEINHTLLTLIPKVDNPVKVTEFWPISLCTVIYKMISKTIVNKLKPIMPLIISEWAKVGSFPVYVCAKVSCVRQVSLVCVGITCSAACALKPHGFGGEEKADLGGV
ncbi:unnamed protein product [Prunus armeniaca]